MDIVTKFVDVLGIFSVFLRNKEYKIEEHTYRHLRDPISFDQFVEEKATTERIKLE